MGRKGLINFTNMKPKKVAIRDSKGELLDNNAWAQFVKRSKSALGDRYCLHEYAKN